VPFSWVFYPLSAVCLLPSLAIIANAVAKGKTKHRLFHNIPFWMTVTLVSGPLNVTITTVMLQVSTISRI
jgi:hypothetical protein